jgi:hypothetical protein
MKTLIVGRTKMGNSRCIGGLCADGPSIRLLDANGHNWHVSTPFQLGQIWELDFHNVDRVRPPHVEDVIVTSFTLLGNEPDARSAILARVQPWQGSSSVLFGGVVGYTGNHNGYVESRIPDRSTGYWIPDKDLILRDDGKHYDYLSTFFGITTPHGLKYVGEPAPIATIRAGTLVRVSLARWWRPDDDESFPERCYVQLSGWF